MGTGRNGAPSPASGAAPAGKPSLEFTCLGGRIALSTLGFGYAADIRAVTLNGMPVRFAAVRRPSRDGSLTGAATDDIKFAELVSLSPGDTLAFL